MWTDADLEVWDSLSRHRQPSIVYHDSLSNPDHIVEEVGRPRYQYWGRTFEEKAAEMRRRPQKATDGEKDLFLWRGDLPALVSSLQGEEVDVSLTMKDARILLRVATMLERWGASLARYINEAADPERLAEPPLDPDDEAPAPKGAHEQLFVSCADALEPKPEALLSRAQVDGFVQRFDVNRALGQCFAYHNLWSQMAPDKALNVGVQRPSVELRPPRRGVWLGRRPRRPPRGGRPRRCEHREPAGHTALQVAIAHGSVELVRMLIEIESEASPDYIARRQATLDLALRVAPTLERCLGLLEALEVSADATTSLQSRGGRAAGGAPGCRAAPSRGGARRRLGRRR